MIRTLAVASIIVALGFSSANAEPYKSTYIRDIPTTYAVNKSVVVSGLPLNYTVSYQSDKNQEMTAAFPPQDIQVALEEIVFYYLLFLGKIGAQSADCRTGFNINLFVISKDKMMEAGRFAAYFKSIGWSDGVVFAFYDTTPEIKANSAILLTNLSPRQNYLSLAHEFSHYMWDRQCLTNSYANSSEHFAKAFEAYIDNNTK